MNTERPGSADLTLNERVSVFLAFLALYVLLSPPAAAQDIRCTMGPDKNGHYIATDIGLAISSYGDVSVEDAVVNSTGRSAVIGSVAREDGRRLVLYWELKSVPPDPKEYRFMDVSLIYRLTIQKADGAARLVATDARSTTEYKATGRCRFGD